MLLRILLVLVLCTDGIFGAWAATRMAVHDAGDAGAINALAPEQSQDSAECDTPADDGKVRHAGDHDGCDCEGSSGCTCSCVLTFFPGRTAPLFAAQHALASVYLAPPLLPAAHHEVSRLFRPPIG